MTSHICLNMLRLERCYSLYFTRHSELLRASIVHSPQLPITN